MKRFEPPIQPDPKNMRYLRNVNRAYILKRLAINGSASRVQLTKELGLSKMAVSTIVSEMLEQNFVQECGQLYENDTPMAAAAGRKPTALVISNQRVNALGIYIARYQIMGVSLDIKGNSLITIKKDLPEDTHNAELEKLIIEVIDQMLAETKGIAYSGIGIASVGPLDIAAQKILKPPNFYNISDFDIGEIVSQRYGFPVFLDNDMNAGALAEQLYGIAKSMRDIVFLGLGYGVGAGVIVNNQMLHGNRGYAGEIGHISIKMDGPQCPCGRRGCLELYTSVRTLLKQSGASTVEEMFDMISSGLLSESLRDCLSDYFEAILSAIVTIANLFDPEVIVIGDYGAKIVLPFLDKLQAQMNELMFQHGLHEIKLMLSYFEEPAPLYGAAALVFDKIFHAHLIPT